MAKRLWDKGTGVHDQVHRFTVGNDPDIDRELVRWDVVGSAAHARMLEKIGILTTDECKSLLSSLRKILVKNENKEFQIPTELDDCHTAIEGFLVEDVGDPGMKIHTGRSRNDQVLLAVRLFLRSEITSLADQLAACIEVIFARIDDVGSAPLPGYTHMQPAMPTSVQMWLHAFAEALLEQLREAHSLLGAVNTNPLGAASGFGVPLPLDRNLVSSLLGFERTQRSPIDIQNSRGRYEMKFIRWGVDIASIIEKIAWDMILFTMKEFSYFGLPVELTTGSSIMPQKQNPDVLELLRGRAAKVRACETELALVTAKLPSNYHRDFQYTKEPVIRCAHHLREMIPMLGVVLESFTINTQRLSAAMTEDLYATYDVYREVRDGVPFREAYRATAERIKAGTLDLAVLQADFASINATAQLEIEAAKTEFASVRESLAKSVGGIERAVQAVLEQP